LPTRPYRELTDREPLLNLLLRCRVAGGVNRELTPARLQLLLTTRLTNPQHNTQIWQDDAGQLLAAGFLLQRGLARPLELTYFIHPHRNQPDETEVFDWVLARAAAIAREQQTALPLFVLLSEHAHATIALLEQNHFTKLDGYSPCMARSLEEPIPSAITPLGFTVRSLTSEDELVQYTDLYNEASSPVSLEQRQHLIARSDYQADLNLVLQADDGTLVAFCECSVSLQEWQLMSQNDGWLEHLGTHPDYQRRGFGRLITVAALHRLKAAGAQRALLMTSSTNIPALKLYEALGFETVERNWIYSWSDPPNLV
jgi:mycothiol synthase